MELALVKHEIRGGGTDCRAIHRQPKMARRQMVATRLKAMRHRHAETGFLAIQAGIDADGDFTAEGMHRGNPVPLSGAFMS
jgi:hypothetical protein